MALRVGVLGSRNFESLLVRMFVGHLAFKKWPIGIVCGNRPCSPDVAAKWEADAKGIPVREFEVHKDGMADGVSGLLDVVTYSDLVVAFWNESADGTQKAMAETRRQRKPLVIIYDDGSGFVDALNLVGKRF